MSSLSNFLACLFVALAPAAAAPGRPEDVPSALREVVLGASKQPHVTLWLGGERYAALERGGAPFLAWPLERGGPDRDPERARAWLARRGAELAHAGFQPVYHHRGLWRASASDGVPLALDVLEFRLEHRGLELLDARVSLYFDGERFLGLLNDVPAPLGARQALSEAAPGVERVWLAIDRGGEPVRDLVVARVEREHYGGRLRTRYRVDGEPLPAVTVVSFQALPPLSSFEQFQEHAVPKGDFPDQVGVGPDGAVWFSQPNQDFITRFEPGAMTFKSFSLPEASRPDGLCVDGAGRVFTGLYGAGELAVRDAAGQILRHALPYPSARPAIPLVTSQGRVWVTDHVRNRVSEFDPDGATWPQSLVVPTPSAWVVAGAEHLPTGVLYFAEYLANRVAVVDPALPVVTELAGIGGGPAFVAVVGDKLYWTQWNRDRLGEYDLSTGQRIEYQYPVPGEFGGPIGATHDGRVVVGTRNVGYLLVFDPAPATFAAYMVPTGSPGLKDGLAVDADGAIWFAESAAGKLAKLALGPSVK